MFVDFPGSVEQSAVGRARPATSCKARAHCKLCLLDLVHWLPCLTICKLHTSKILRSSFNLHRMTYKSAALDLALHSALHLLLHNRLGFGLLLSLSFLRFFFFYLEASSAAAQQRSSEAAQHKSSTKSGCWHGASFDIIHALAIKFCLLPSSMSWSNVHKTRDKWMPSSCRLCSNYIYSYFFCAWCMWRHVKWLLTSPRSRQLHETTIKHYKLIQAELLIQGCMQVYKSIEVPWEAPLASTSAIDSFFPIFPIFSSRYWYKRHQCHLLSIASCMLGWAGMSDSWRFDGQSRTSFLFRAAKDAMVDLTLQRPQLDHSFHLID